MARVSHDALVAEGGLAIPYIDKDDRRDFDPTIDNTLFRPANGAGELNFSLARVCDRYIIKNGRNYGTFNDVVGALECLKLEVYRRLAVPHEEMKLAINGEVFEAIR